MIVNIDYPLGMAAYNILREIAESTDELRGVYVLGKAATLNADVGDVHDLRRSSTTSTPARRTGSTTRSRFDDIAPYLRSAPAWTTSGRSRVQVDVPAEPRVHRLLLPRGVTRWSRWRRGRICNAVYEIADADRYPVGEAVNFAKLPIDFGVIHYASDTPYTQARTLGARGLSYYGMDSTYASVAGDPAPHHVPRGPAAQRRRRLSPAAASEQRCEASSAPSLTARSLSHATCGSTREKRMKVSKPQSVPPITRSVPMTFASA